MRDSGIVFACIAPHGGEIIPELAGANRDLFAPTRRAMEEIGRRMMSALPDTIIVLTPHGFRLDRYVSVVTAENAAGTLEENGACVQASFACDRDLAVSILEGSRQAALPVVGVNFGAMEGPASRVELDWGALIPLWFMGARSASRPRIVLIGPNRAIPLSNMVQLGEIIADEAARSGRRVGLVASADQGHAHDIKGPYGFDPASAAYDQLIQDIVRRDDLARLLTLDLDFVEAAKPDSLWQMLALYGASRKVPMKGELLSYQVPTYFGMACAAYMVL